jgi:hypothetical protein
MLRFQTRTAIVTLVEVGLCAAMLPSPRPLALWTFQEPSGAPKITDPRSAFNYSLVDADPHLPILQADRGVFGPHAAYFPANTSSASQRLFATRELAPALTVGIAGPSAVVTLVAWISDAATQSSLVAGVWDENYAARQYALFVDLGTCASNAPVYHGGIAAHISDCGGPTPGSRYCTTAACDPEPLATGGPWHCVANVYDGAAIRAYVNGTLHANGAHNPFPYPGGIYSPEAAGKQGAEFGVGANFINTTVGGPRVLSNRFKGLLGGLAVFDVALTPAELGDVCGWAPGF